MNTIRKKSKASRVQPRYAASTTFLWLLVHFIRFSPQHASGHKSPQQILTAAAAVVEVQGPLPFRGGSAETSMAQLQQNWLKSLGGGTCRIDPCTNIRCASSTVRRPRSRCAAPLTAWCISTAD